jgi:hypothetical protein
MTHDISVVNIVDGPKIYKPEGKSWRLYTFIVDGLIDGEDAAEFELKTFSSDISKKIESGDWSGKAKRDTFKGKISYVVEDDKFQKKQYPAKQSGYVAKSYQPPTQYSLGEFEDLILHAWKFSGDTLAGIAGATVADRCALAATFLIGAQKSGIKINKNEE